MISRAGGVGDASATTVGVAGGVFAHEIALVRAMAASSGRERVTTPHYDAETPREAAGTSGARPRIPRGGV